MLPPAHLGYLMSGVDDDATLKLNREGFQHFQLRARRLVDVSKPDLRTEVFGVPWETPIFLCPVGGQKMFNPEGEVAVARAAKAKKATQILSTVSSSPMEDVARALGGPLWYQLYMPVNWEGTEKMVRRAEAAGCPVLVWTVDLLGGRNTETATRMRRTDTRNCLACHTNGVGSLKGRPNLDGIEGGINPAAANWTYLDRLRKLTKMKVIIKGIDTAEDARLCREHGADAVVVSNHGGRATETLRSTIESLRRSGGRGGQPNSGAGGRRLPARDGYLQGAGTGGARCGHRTALHLRAHGLRPGRRGAGPGYPARRIAADHATVRNPGHQGHHAGGHSTKLAARTGIVHKFDV